MKKIVTRFAPSPTGYVHVGNIRIALMNYLLTRQNYGEFILRIDDTDKERSKDEYTEAIKKDLAWLGYDYVRTFRQSENIGLYDKAFSELLKQGLIYPCYETTEELDVKRKLQLSRGLPPIYDRGALLLTEEDKAKLEAAGRKPHYRFKIQDIDCSWVDLIKGEVVFHYTKLGDPVVRKEDGQYLYTFCSVIDDIDSNITHIVRGEDHLTNTAVQIQLFKCLGASNIPVFAHLPLLSMLDGTELSKRVGGNSIGQMRERGVLPAAINHYLSTLGRGETAKINLNLQELAEDFDISSYGGSALRFDNNKLNQINSLVLQGMNATELLDYISSVSGNVGNVLRTALTKLFASNSFLATTNEEKFSQLWDLIKNNVVVLTDISNWIEVTCGGQDKRKTLQPRLCQDVRKPLTVAKSALANLNCLQSSEVSNNTLDPYQPVTHWLAKIQEETQLRPKDIFKSLRNICTFKDGGPDFKPLFKAISPSLLQKRLEGYITHNTLKIFNTKTGSMEAFQPKLEEHISMYVCGPTLWDELHIGNARSLIFFDVLYRVLLSNYSDHHIKYVRNITDIDDKIIKKSKELGVSSREVVDINEKIYKKHLQALSILTPSVEPKATENLETIIAIITKLLDKGLAYVKDSHVFFKVKAFQDYGALSNRRLEEMGAGLGRGSIAQDFKEEVEDFVLWKPSKEGEPSWDSPFGSGRPGWHIECSAMVHKHVGQRLDIHGGGQDLIFPHHENERAQSMGAFGCSCLASYWVHNSFVNYKGSKMAKSVGNVMTITEVLNSVQPEVLRLSLLMTHYRDTLDITEDRILEARTILDSMYERLSFAEQLLEGQPSVKGELYRIREVEEQITRLTLLTKYVDAKVSGLNDNHPSEREVKNMLIARISSFKEALLKDIDTVSAIQVLNSFDFTAVKLQPQEAQGKSSVSKEVFTKCLLAELATFVSLSQLLGVLNTSAKSYFTYRKIPISNAEVEAKISSRIAAKKAKNYNLADAIRTQLLVDHGVVIRDANSGEVKWTWGRK